MPEHPDQPILRALQENEISLEVSSSRAPTTHSWVCSLTVTGKYEWSINPSVGNSHYGTFLPERWQSAKWLPILFPTPWAGTWSLPHVYRRRKLPLGPGSLQLFIEHDPNHNYFTLREDYQSEFEKVCLFDLLLNNADRKGGHILQDAAGKIWLIDHGLCFHLEYK
jgi:hypothetical protein